MPEYWSIGYPTELVNLGNEPKQAGEDNQDRKIRLQDVGMKLYRDGYIVVSLYDIIRVDFNSACLDSIHSFTFQSVDSPISVRRTQSRDHDTWTIFQTNVSRFLDFGANPSDVVIVAWITSKLELKKLEDILNTKIDYSGSVHGAGGDKSPNLAPMLLFQGAEITSNPTSVGASKIVDTTLSGFGDGYFDGRLVKIISGTGTGQERTVQEYVDDTTTLKMTQGWTIQPDTSSEYIIERGFQKVWITDYDVVEDGKFGVGNYNVIIHFKNATPHTYNAAVTQSELSYNNIVENPGFARLDEGWTNQNLTTMSISNDVYETCGISLKINDSDGYVYQGITLESGREYIIKARVRVNSGGTFKLNLYDGSSNESSGITNTNNKFQTVTLTITPSVSACELRLNVSGSSDAYVDCVGIYPSLYKGNDDIFTIANTGGSDTSVDDIVITSQPKDILDQFMLTASNDQLLNTSITKIAQSFVPSSSTLSKIKLKVKKSSPDADLTISIQADSSGDPSGTTLHSVTLLAADVTTSYVVYTIDLPWLLTPGATYHIVVESALGSGSYTFQSNAGGTNQYLGGTLLEYTGSWADASNEDLYFATYFISLPENLAFKNVKDVSKITRYGKSSDMITQRLSTASVQSNTYTYITQTFQPTKATINEIGIMALQTEASSVTLSNLRVRIYEWDTANDYVADANTYWETIIRPLNIAITDQVLRWTQEWYYTTDGGTTLTRVRNISGLDLTNTYGIVMFSDNGGASNHWKLYYITPSVYSGGSLKQNNALGTDFSEIDTASDLGFVITYEDEPKTELLCNSNVHIIGNGSGYMDVKLVTGDNKEDIANLFEHSGITLKT